MAIPARQIVAVTPRLLTAGGTDFVINGMLLTKNSIMPLTARAISFSDADSVGDYFGTTSDEYNAALVYFKGFNNSFKKPTTLYFGAWVDSNKSAWLRGGAYTGTLATLKSITDGALKITIDDTERTITGLNLGTATSLSNVAELISAAMTSGSTTYATVSYSSRTEAFTITSATAGTTSKITFADTAASGTDLGTVLNLTETLGAVLSQGEAAQTAAENMRSITQSSNAWGCFTTLWEQTDEEIVELATWVALQNGDYLYLPWSNETQLTTVGAVTSIAKTLDAMEATGTSGCYSLKDSLLCIAIWASIDWDREQAMVTASFKKQEGMAAEINDATSASLLVEQKWNFYGNYATRNDRFIWLFEGRMFGDYGFQDSYVGAMWLNNALQLALMNALGTFGRIPYTPTGYELLRNAMLRTIKRAKKNGVIDAGMALSETQKAELTTEYGNSSIVDEIQNEGYCLQVTEAGAEARVNRTSPQMSLWYSYAGSVHRCDLSSTCII